MTKNKLFVDLLQLVLIVLIIFFSISLMSSGKNVDKNLREVKNKEYPNKNSVIVKYKLIHGSDTIYVDRKLDSILNSREYIEFFNKK